MKKWTRRQWDDHQEYWGMAISLLLLLSVVVPLFRIAYYNYPTSDDFSYGGAIYRGIQNGESFWKIVGDVLQTARTYYLSWQGRYFDDLVSAAGVGIAVPEYYFLGTYLVLGTFVIAGVVCYRLIGTRILKWSGALSTMIAALVTTMQVLYVPYADEAFYWYVGATGYTWTFALLLLLVSCYICFYTTSGRWSRWGLGICAVLLIAAIGGSNYAVCLVTAELFALGVLVLLVRRVLRKGDKARFRPLDHSWFLVFGFVEFLICFACNALSKGNHARMSHVDGLGVFPSIIESLHRGLVFLGEWFHGPVLLLLVFVLFLSLRPLAESEYSFPMPGLVLLVSYGVYSSVVTAPLFADGTWGPGRLINVMYYIYYIFLIGNMLYLSGYVLHKSVKCRDFVMEVRLQKVWSRGVLPGFLVFGILLLVCIKMYGLQSTNTTSAVLSLVKGEAQIYRAENEARWALFEDPAVTDVVLEDFSVKPHVLYHDDFSTDEGDWRNTTVAGFFGKNTVKLVLEDE